MDNAESAYTLSRSRRSQLIIHGMKRRRSRRRSAVVLRRLPFRTNATLSAADGAHFLFRFGSHLRHRIHTHTTRSLLRRYIPSGVVLIRSRRCGRDGVKFLATYGKPLVHSGPHNQQAMLRKFLRNFAFSRGVLANLPMTTKVMPLRLSPPACAKICKK